MEIETALSALWAATIPAIIAMAVALYRTRLEAATAAAASGEKLGALQRAVEVADRPSFLRRERKIVVVGPATADEAEARQMERYLRSLGWKQVSTHLLSNRPDAESAARAADIVVLDRVLDADMAALDRDVRSDNYVVFCPATHQGGRANLASFGDRAIAANSRPQAAHWMEVALLRADWFQRSAA